VHPQTGRLVIVSKSRQGPSAVYTFPPDLAPGATVTLTRAGELTFGGGSPLATSGDVHPQGRGVLIRTYTNAWFFAGEPGQSIEQMLKSPPCAVPVAVEPQGEAIAWTRSGAGYLTVSEGAPVLHPVRCEP
jgi:hypothetical protein